MSEPGWTIELLGILTVKFGDRTITNFGTRKAAALLGYLAINPDKAHSREDLLDIFWPDMKSGAARHNLRQTIFTLRKVLDEPADSPLLIASSVSIGLRREVLQTDLHQFDECIRQAKGAASDEDAFPVLNRAAELYKGELLAGCFDGWLLSERRRVEVEALQALAALQRYHQARSAHSDSIRVGSRLLSLDPFNDAAHIAAIRSYVMAGHPRAGERHLEDYERQCAEELGRPISARTREMALAALAEKPVSQPQRQAGSDRKAPRRLSVQLMGASAVAVSLLGGFMFVSASGIYPQRPSVSHPDQGHEAKACAKLVEQAWSEWYGPNEAQWLSKLDNSSLEIRTALTWNLDHDPDTALQMAGALTRWWYMRDARNEGYLWLSEALARSSNKPTRERARALVGCAFLAARHETYEDAQLRTALSIYTSCNDKWGIAHARRHMGFFASERHISKEAMEQYAIAMAGFRELHDEGGQAVTALCIAYVPNIGVQQKNYWAQAALSAFRHLHSDWGVSLSLMAASTAHSAKDPTFTSLNNRAFKAYHRLGFLNTGEMYEQALLAIRRNDLVEGRRILLRILSVAREQNDQVAIANLLNWHADLLASKPELRVKLLSAVRKLDHDLQLRQDPVSVNESRRQMAALQAALGQTRFQHAEAVGLNAPLEDVLAEILISA
ncbi:MAG: winged helix-turn-helix domain-containing protein [Armatimonadetes bacterium]|nr:winged helix-turn-helix domain-containing protein [Armatimonadota bacterium]